MAYQNNKLPQGFFPRFIDRPRLIGIFEIDEFFLSFGIIFIIITASLAFPNIGSLIVMLVSVTAGISAGVAYKKFKRNRPNGYTAHLLYKMGAYHPLDNKKAYFDYPYLRKNKAVPFGFTKELIN
jgi:hypothetical protein